MCTIGSMGTPPITGGGATQPAIPPIESGESTPSQSPSKLQGVLLALQQVVTQLSGLISALQGQQMIGQSPSQVVQQNPKRLEMWDPSAHELITLQDQDKVAHDAADKAMYAALAGKYTAATPTFRPDLTPDRTLDILNTVYQAKQDRINNLQTQIADYLAMTGTTIHPATLKLQMESAANAELRSIIDLATANKAKITPMLANKMIAYADYISKTGTLNPAVMNTIRAELTA